MDDSLLSYEEADAIAREMCDDWIKVTRMVRVYPCDSWRRTSL